MATSSGWQEKVDLLLGENQFTWCVTGAAGFIGSHLVESLLGFNQKVIGVDNFSTGRMENLNLIESAVGAERFKNFRFIEADICNNAAMKEAFTGVDYVLHQAALGSVPRSIANPVATNNANVNGFVSVLNAASKSAVKALVYASSSSVYGDSTQSPKSEEILGNLLSPYAASKRVDEIYADVFFRVYGLPIVGLRYFNVFGPRQDPEGPYAAVIPRWIETLCAGKRAVINGDGLTTRDFCYVDNVVQANLLSALKSSAPNNHEVYNVSLGGEITLNELYELIVSALKKLNVEVKDENPEYGQFREGDIRHSRASIERINKALGYTPSVQVADGIEKTTEFFARK